MTILAHPDDAEFGCGGTLATWARLGTDITMVIITDGSKGSDDRAIADAQLVQLRIAEQDRAARALGVARVVRLGYEDGVLAPTVALRRDIARVIRQHRPEVVITGDPDSRIVGGSYINHPDHRAAAEAALYGIFPAAGNHRFFPELLAEGLEPHKVTTVLLMVEEAGDTCFVDISGAIDAKIDALAEHKSQFDITDVEAFVRKWAAEAGKQYGVAFAEAYRTITLEQPPAEQAAEAIAEGLGEPGASAGSGG
jgi:LmbE family N-acetylglucosaminyl deacetylase